MSSEDWGVKISLPGVDVKTATAKELVLSTAYPNPKVQLNKDPAHFGMIQLIYNGANQIVGDVSRNITQFAHGYNYTPGTQCLIIDPVSGVAVQMPYQVGALGVFVFEADETYVYLNWSAIGLFPTEITPGIYNFRYYLFADPVADDV